MTPFVGEHDYESELILVMTTAGNLPGQVFASVWDALEDRPAEAANMRLRSDLMIAIRQVVGIVSLHVV
jgi:hypothetical protein